MIRQNPREDFQRVFARMWPMRHDPPRLLPNGIDYVNTRGSIRDNIRGQRDALAYHRRMHPDLYA